MKCELCSNPFEWMADVPCTHPQCPECINAGYEHDMARNRANRVHYYKELVVIGKAEFECSGYFQDNRLWDQEVFINGQDVYGLISDHVEAQIFEEITKHVVSGEIDRVYVEYKDHKLIKGVKDEWRILE